MQPGIAEQGTVDRPTMATVVDGPFTASAVQLPPVCISEPAMSEEGTREPCPSCPVAKQHTLEHQPDSIDDFHWVMPEGVPIYNMAEADDSQKEAVQRTKSVPQSVTSQREVKERSKSVSFSPHLHAEENKKGYQRTPTPYWARSPAGSMDSRDEPDFAEFQARKNKRFGDFLVPGPLKDDRKN